MQIYCSQYGANIHTWKTRETEVQLPGSQGHHNHIQWELKGRNEYIVDSVFEYLRS